MAALATDSFLAVDRCLDGGGSFDYAHRTCDMLHSHPYRPSWHDDLSLLMLGLGATVAGLVVALTRSNKNVP